MRAVDLALYADTLAAEADTIAARLERSRTRLRQASIEHDVRVGLPPEVVARLERLGVLSAGGVDGTCAEMVELQASLAALEVAQAWVERQLADAGGPATARRLRGAAAEEPAMAS